MIGVLITQLIQHRLNQVVEYAHERGFVEGEIGLLVV